MKGVPIEYLKKNQDVVYANDQDGKARLLADLDKKIKYAKTQK
jgi:hypothetical protein